MKFLKRFGLEPFILLLFTAIFLAWLAPGVGCGEGVFSLSAVATWGVSVIFFFYGVRLDTEKIRTGLADYRLHAVIQLATFLLFPLLVFPAVYYFQSMAAEGPDRTLWLGVFFLAALPSTVSSSVIMVNLARGNVTAAIFNASISSLLGVFITPMWMQIWLASAGGMPISGVLISLTMQVILPVTLGVCLHRLLSGFSQKHDKTLRKFDQTIILLIVYTAFCHSFAENMFAGFTLRKLLMLSVGMAALFFAVFGLISLACRILRFGREDRITAVFCGSKKSLVHGTVMSRVLMEDVRLSGVLLLPTMIYHALQLIFVSIIAQRMRDDEE